MKPVDRSGWIADDAVVLGLYLTVALHKPKDKIAQRKRLLYDARKHSRKIEAAL